MMNKIEQIICSAVLVFTIFVCVGFVGAFSPMHPLNASVLVRNTEVQESDRTIQNVVDSKSETTQSQKNSNSTKNSLFDSLNSNSNLFDLKRTLLSLVDGATEQELVALFHESREHPMAFNSVSTTHWLRSVVLTELMNVDAERAHSLIEQLDEQTANIVLSGVMREWNQMHMNEAVKFLTAFDEGLRRLGLVGLIDGNSNLSHTNLREIGSELGFEADYVTSLLDKHQQGKNQISLDDLAIEFKNFDSSDTRQFQLVERKVVGYVREEGLDSLPSVLELFDTVSMNNHSMPLTVRIFWHSTRMKLVSALAKDDPEEVFEYVARLGEDVDVDLLTAVSEVWFAADPDALWNRLRDEDLSTVHYELSENVISHWARTEPELALVSLEMFPTKYHDQVIFEVAWIVSDDSPFEALELLLLSSDWSDPPRDLTDAEENSDRNTRSDFLVNQIISTATREDPIATIEWIDSVGSRLNASVKQQRLDQVFRIWARSESDTVFEMAIQTPIADGAAGLEAIVVGWWAQSDVDRAITMLPRVREGETKADAYRRVASKLEEQDRISDAIQLGNDLPELERKEYNKSLARDVGFREPFSYLIDGIRQLPTQELQSEAVRFKLIYTYYGNEIAPDFTVQQLDQLKEFMTEAEKQLVNRYRGLVMQLLEERRSGDAPTTEVDFKKLIEELEIEE